MDSSILTLILLAPLAGAVLVALLPDRGKLPAWLTLITTLITFGLTLHLPAHFDVHQSGFQFEVNQPWIENPAIFYHVGVDGLSLWLVVLVGLLGPVGVLASWNSINRRQKVFYSLFLLQQTAMYGVFISLDLMLYYGFWELSLVPMAILIAMYGRKEGSRRRQSSSSSSPSFRRRRCSSRFFTCTHEPALSTSANCNVNIAAGVVPAGALFWVALAFLFAFAVKVPMFPAARLARRHFRRSACGNGDGRRRQAGPLFDAALPRRPLPCPVTSHRASSDHAGRHRHSLRCMPCACTARLLAIPRLRCAQSPEPDHSWHLRIHLHRVERRHLSRSSTTN